jgi:hypothetical protein
MQLAPRSRRFLLSGGLAAVLGLACAGPVLSGPFDKGPPEPVLLTADSDPAQAFKLLIDRKSVV